MAAVRISESRFPQGSTEHSQRTTRRTGRDLGGSSNHNRGGSVVIKNQHRRQSAPKTLCARALDLLPQRLQQQLSKCDRKQILEAFDRLEACSAHLDYLPVFGYLSLRSDNYRELGKASQADVVPGRDVVCANLPDHGLDFILSTVYRGTPEHPGVVAGLSEKAGVETPGVLLKIPKHPERVAAILEREFFAESDLVDIGGVSNSMYRPYLKEVNLQDGTASQAIVFLTNEDSAKAISHRQTMTPQLLAWLMTGEGGFRSKDEEGNLKGGACWNYWNDSYLQPRRAKAQEVDPLVEEALNLAKLIPSRETLEYMDQRATSEARLMGDALLTVFDGVCLPRELQSGQKPEAEQQMVRCRSEQRPTDNTGAGLLAVAKEMRQAGRI